MFKKLILAFSILTVTHSRIIDKCQFAEELIKNHNLSIAETKKHVCVLRGDIIKTDDKSDVYFGIYKISTQWWCGKDGKEGGGCGIKCEGLLDDDIADDVNCARKILLGSGIEGWGVSAQSCRQFIEGFSKECPLKEFFDHKDVPIRTTTQKSTTLASEDESEEELISINEKETEKILTTTTSQPATVEEEATPEIVTSFHRYKINPNLSFNIYNFNISGNNHKIQYEI